MNFILDIKQKYAIIFLKNSVIFGEELVMTKEREPCPLFRFNIPADDPTRAQKFYGEIFGWQFDGFPGSDSVWDIDGCDVDDGCEGGLHQRRYPTQTITPFIKVPSVVEYSKMVVEHGGEIIMDKYPVMSTGYFCICKDPEGNEISL